MLMARGLAIGLPLAIVLWVLLIAIVLWLASCAPLPKDLQAPTSRAALANPNCWLRCYVTVDSTDDNKVGAGTFAPAGTSSVSVSSQETKGQ
jgi:hypothetical protein